MSHTQSTMWTGRLGAAGMVVLLSACLAADASDASSGPAADEHTLSHERDDAAPKNRFAYFACFGIATLFNILERLSDTDHHGQRGFAYGSIYASLRRFVSAYEGHRDPREALAHLLRARHQLESLTPAEPFEGADYLHLAAAFREWEAAFRERYGL